MSSYMKPANLSQLQDCLAWAVSSETPVSLIGGNSRASLGHTVPASHTLDMSHFSGIELYQPEELVLTAGAGTPMSEIYSALHEQGQYLPFTPFHPDRTLEADISGTQAAGTLGGMIATGIAGARRPHTGSVRDYILGVEGVTGRAAPFKAGGRVVKNVTGYDLPKLMTGSFGTLAALTRITIKVLPKPTLSRTLMFAGLDQQAGIDALHQASLSNCEPTGLTYLPTDCAARAGLEDSNVALIRLEGTEASVQDRTEALIRLIGKSCEVLTGETEETLWHQITSASVLPAASQQSLWRITLPPSEVTDFLNTSSLQHYYICWGGGLIWALAPDENWRPQPRSGTAMAIRRTRDEIPFILPPSAGIKALAKRLKESFDPTGILNPGKLYGDF
ncbi:2-hydroxy-acid oxidase [Kordiimonas sediminis]|uniref:2-hydroxy-acid oxidase n=1 Tax=Kordiimonas sediminis TaxID=1735581 RepID=A0A919ASI2_9PROT|nr:FAD-binding protein [Kordiimonas sediminis]GHF20670.1 2-hydroxy-acid oxidase [Kordiimonas sediminis]